MSAGKSIAEVEKEIIDEFSFFDSWDEKYEYIIELGKKLPPLDPAFRQDVYKVKGCQSTVWLGSKYKEGKVFFEADSDSVIVKGLISLLIRVLSTHSTEDIIAAPLDFIDRIGMSSHLAQTRANGLLAMVKQMKQDAMAYKLKFEMDTANSENPA